ncbi:hypothetical protein VNO78_10583 [Psophocarpus tetragonolobus]|uniref:Uncharacterized protein n=1 Tax=Psophocarpus tetragonolobus TaxID=3891 RepID=A0AAN9XMN3_PSOTE
MWRSGGSDKAIESKGIEIVLQEVEYCSALSMPFLSSHSVHKPFRMGHAFGAQCLLPVPAMHHACNAFPISSFFSMPPTLHFWLYSVHAWEWGSLLQLCYGGIMNEVANDPDGGSCVDPPLESGRAPTIEGGTEVSKGVSVPSPSVVVATVRVALIPAVGHATKNVPSPSPAARSGSGLSAGLDNDPLIPQDYRVI